MRRETVGDRPCDMPVFRVFCVFRGYNTRGASAVEFGIRRDSFSLLVDRHVRVDDGDRLLLDCSGRGLRDGYG